MTASNSREDPREDPSIAAFSARRAERARRHTERVRARTAAAASVTPPVSSRKARRTKRFVTAAAIGASVSLALTGCGLSNGLYDVPLPGGADLGSDPLTLHVRMNNVYDLVPQAAVKIHNVTVGKVTDIALANKQSGKWQADVTIETNRGQTKLPENAMGQLRQTSLLGEKFVELVDPPDGAHGRLANNAKLQEDPNFNHVEVEQIFGALSLLLNNGGLPQIRTISNELSNAMSGREGDIKGLLRNLTNLVSTLDSHSGDILKALDNAQKLSGTLDAQKDRLTGAIDNLTPGLKTLRDQRTQLVGMLKAMQRLSGVTVDTIDKTRTDMIADLKALEPSLRKLADTGDNLANSLPLLATIPFGDYAAKTFRGDYDNLYANIDLDLGHLIQNMGRSRQNFLTQTGLFPPGTPGINDQNPPQPGQPDAGTGSGTYPNDPDYGKPPQQVQGQQPQQEVGPNAPSEGSGSGGGLGGIFGTLSGGGAF
ncbi:MCE family protein [Sciscionella marina]|uniref:MCE family protein n=1 Tax=Sciscionella marina TaxID=508770 RepID=UPI00036F3B1E|nr:MCE family protein [Sciscionella marina]